MDKWGENSPLPEPHSTVSHFTGTTNQELTPPSNDLGEREQLCGRTSGYPLHAPSKVMLTDSSVPGTFRKNPCSTRT